MQFSKIPPYLMGFNTLQKQLWEGGEKEGGVRGREGMGGGEGSVGRRRSGGWGEEEGGRRGEVGWSWGLDVCALWVFSALVCSFLQHEP